MAMSLDCVENLEEEMGDKETISPEDEFFKAILDNNTEEVKRKIANGFTALSRSGCGNMALHFACLNSKLEILHLLKYTLKEGEVDTINIEEDDSICGTALHMAMDGQVNPEITKFLLSLGANPNVVDAKGSPVLHELIYRAWEDLEEDFVSEKYMRNETSCGEVKELTPNTAAGASYFMKLDLLVNGGADINLMHSLTGQTPLHYWCQNFSWNMEHFVDDTLPEWCFIFLEHVIKYGADINILNKREHSALMFLERKFKPNHEEFMESYRQVFSILLPKVSDINKRDGLFLRTLIHFAAELSNYILLEELLKFTSDVNVQDKFGLSPLHLITHNITNDETTFVIKIIDMLVENGAKLDIQDDYGSTPLHHAIHLKNSVALKHLLQLGASTDVIDKFGRNVRDLALIEGDQTILDVLDVRLRCHEDAIVEGRSDIRYGWFYPMCCYKKYDTSSRGIEEPAMVEYDSVASWLEKFPMCLHNAKFILRNSASSLEKNTQQMALTEADSGDIKQEIYDLMKNISRIIKEHNPLFASNIIFGGSVSEGTKVGSPDEIDIVFDLYTFRDIMSVEEETDLPGFARLKVIKSEDISKYGIEDMINEENYLNRSKLSRTFHKYFDESLHSKQIIEGNRFFYWWGSVDALGECSNIGQLHLIWYGPFLKRQTVSVDIAPVIRVPGWHSLHVQKKISILNKNIAMSVGCYLVMKDLSPVITNILENTDESCMNGHPILETEAFLFKLSLSQLEHAAMKFLPHNIKFGFQIAKSIQLQCPNVIVSVNDIYPISKEPIPETLKCVVEVVQYLTSFVLKTALFYEIDNQGICIECNQDDFLLDRWNSSVISLTKNKGMKIERSDIREAISWALCIYKRLLMIVEEKNMIPEYFLPVISATKGPCNSFVKIYSGFLKTLIYLLEHFRIPEDMTEKDPAIIYHRASHTS